MARTLANDPLQRFRFTVEINGAEMGCQTVSGLGDEIEVTEYREGGYHRTRKLPGIPNTTEVTIEKGVFPDITAFELFRSARDKADFRTTVVITENDRLGNPVRQWELTEAWVSSYTAPELDATSSEVSVESIVIQYEDLIPTVL